MTFTKEQTKEQTSKMLAGYMKKWTKQLEGVEGMDTPAWGMDTPAWVAHGMSLINRAQVYIVSVQPMSSPVGGIAFYRPQPQWEPSAVERLAALAEPNGELAQRIADYDDQQTLLSNL